MCESELETKQNCNILTTTLMAISDSFPFSLVAKPGPWGPSLSGCWFSLLHLISNSSDPQLVWSPTDWLQTRLIPKWLNFLCTAYYNCSTPTLLVGVSNRTHSTRPRSRLYSDIPRADAPVFYTGAFPILTARPGRRSIYNTFSLKTF